MGVKYNIEFKTLNGSACEILLDEKGYTGSVREIIAGGTPALIETDSADLYFPMRASSATLSVYGSDYLQDLYTSDPQGVKVIVKVNDDVRWLGFLSPDTFSQDFSRPEFIYGIECVSALSSLKYKEFDVESGFISFLDIIKKAKTYAGYDLLYLTNSVRSTTGSFYDLKIAAGNFWDELGKPMTYYEVLEEIAKYAGCTFTPYKNDLYLLDYKAIRMGFNVYERYSGNSKSFVTLTDAKSVTEYKGTGVKMSRIAGKNKATVNCSLYEIKDILPAFDDEDSEVWWVAPYQEFGESIKVGKDTQNWKGIVRYYKQPKFTFYHYRTPGTPEESDSPPTLGRMGSGFVRTTEFEADKVPVKLNMANEVQVRLFETGNNLRYLRGAKILTLKTDKQILFHKDVWFCVNFQFRLTRDVWNKDRQTGVADKDRTEFLKVMFRLGEYYYNGSNWVTYPITFSVPVSYKKGDPTLGTYKNIDNKNTYDKGLGDLTGFIFKAPNFAVAGDCELALFTPDSAFFDAFIIGIPGVITGMQYMYFKDISFAYGVPDQGSIYGDYMSRTDKSDAVYENVIGDFVEEAEDVRLRICTNVDKKLALSSVVQGNDFAGAIVTDTYGEDVAEKVLIKRITSLFSSPRIVLDPTLENDAKPWTVYTEPHLNKQFMVAGGEEDVKAETVKYNLIEI